MLMFLLCFVYCQHFVFFFFKQKTAYEMRISDWSSDVCSSDLAGCGTNRFTANRQSAAGLGLEGFARSRRVKGGASLPMNEIASPGQLRLAYARWALVTVPAIVFLGFLSGKLANSGYGNRWFAALAKPELIPPGWVFGAAWTVLYVLMEIGRAIVLHARGAREIGRAHV